MYIVKKILRDIPSSLFLTLGMALTFFLMLNSINIIRSINYEREIKEKESYFYDEPYEIIMPNEKVEEIDGTLCYSSDDFDGRFFLEEVIAICSEFDGNACLVTGMKTKDGLGHTIHTYLCINEERVISLDNGKRDVIMSKTQVKGKAYVPEGMKSYIEDGRVRINGSIFDVAGVINDNSINMSEDIWVIVSDDLDDEFKNVILSTEGDRIYSGYQGFWIRFQTNDSDGAEKFEKIEKKLLEKGFIVRGLEKNSSNSEDEVDVSEYVFVLQSLNTILIVFAIVSCMYVISLWIDRRISELMIRKSFGGSTKVIICVIVKDLLKLSSISMIVAVLLQIVYREVFPVVELMINIEFKDILLVAGGMLAIVAALLVVPVVKVIRLVPATGIKEE